jgi:cytoskeletal protein RodZ
MDISNDHKPSTAGFRGPLPGEILREARRSRDLSIQEIAKELRLSVSTVDALENDDYKSLPASIFVQGYIRSYAALLGLDADPLLTQFTVLTDADPVPTPSVTTTAKLSKPQPEASVSHAIPMQSISTILFIGLLLFGAILLYHFQMRDEGTSFDPEKVNVALSDDKLKNFEEFIIDNPRQKVAGNASGTAVKRAIDSDVLSISVSSESYIYVIDANKNVLVSGLHAAGFKKFRGTAPFKFRVQKIDHIEVKLNGRLIDHIKLAKKTGATTAGNP